MDDRANDESCIRDEKFPSLFPSLFSIRDGIPSLFSVSILQFSCSDTSYLSLSLKTRKIFHLKNKSLAFSCNMDDRANDES